MRKIQELALEYSELFKIQTRNNGREFLVCEVDDCHPLKDIIRKAHGEMLPDDYKYKFVHEALVNISNAADLDEVQCEPDIYDHELLAWLSSNLSRVAYVDVAMLDNGHSKNGLMGDIAMGQWAKKSEVLSIVINELENLVKESEAA